MKFKKRSLRPQSEINITPLVDVMLVLLVIFMVTAPMSQQGIDVNLPKTINSGLKTTEEPFLLKIKKNQSLFLGNKKVKAIYLRKKLKSIFKKRRNKQIYIQADKNVRYGFVAKVMAEVRAAGIYNIGLVTTPGSSF